MRAKTLLIMLSVLGVPAVASGQVSVPITTPSTPSVSLPTNPTSPGDFPAAPNTPGMPGTAGGADSGGGFGGITVHLVQAAEADAYALAVRHRDSVRASIRDLRRLEKTLTRTADLCSKGATPDCAIIDALSQP